MAIVSTVKPYAFALVLGVLLSAPAFAWGPVTHQVLGCRVVGAVGSSCFATATQRSFVLGSSAPDAFKLFLERGKHLHELDYAAFQLRYAESNPDATTESFDALAYSRAFGTHLAEDAVGHHAEGFLPGNLSATRDHLQEATMDSFQEKTFPGGYESQRFSAFGDAVVDFSTKSIRAYGKEKGNEKFANVTREAVAKAMHKFDRLEAWELVASAVNLPYRRELVALDPYGAVDFEEAQANLERASECSRAAAATWEASMSDAATSAADARKAVKAKVEALFRQGKCQPAPSP